MGLVAHLSNFVHVAQLLLDENGLEHDEHNQREDGIVPVLVQAPQRHTKHLEDEERRRGAFLEQLHEVRDLHHHAGRKLA